MKHLLKKSLAISSAVAPLAHGIIVPIDANITIGTAERLYIDFSTGEASTDQNAVTEQNVFLRFSTNNYNANGDEKPMLTISGNYAAAGSPTYLTKYNLGAALDFTSSATGAPYFENNGTGNWVDDTAGDVGYVALRNTTTSKEAWLAIDYNDAANTLKLISFAVADASDDMVAGQVPEPAETGALMALAAGSAALYRSRKKKLAQQQSA
jgi:hypothetical protein